MTHLVGKQIWSLVLVGNAWRGALQEYKVQNEGGTQLAEILTAAGYSTINEPKPTASEAKTKVDDLYGEYGLNATARDYKDSGKNMNWKNGADKRRLPGVIMMEVYKDGKQS